MSNDAIFKLLSQHGLKCTHQRLDVLGTLINANSPMTADMIFSQLNNISRSTVYRILEKLTESGIVIREAFNGSTEMYYEAALMTHRHYAVCLGCHKMQYIDDCPVHDAKVSHFTVTGHRLELYGYCDECGRSRIL